MSKPRKQPLLVNTVSRPASLLELVKYCQSRELTHADAEHLWDHWHANGWKVGRVPMKDWQATVRYWQREGCLPSQKAQRMERKPTIPEMRKTIEHMNHAAQNHPYHALGKNASPAIKASYKEIKEAIKRMEAKLLAAELEASK